MTRHLQPQDRRSISNARRLHVETLEDRRLLAVFTVSNTDDAGAGSLRDAITMANATVDADTIDLTGVVGTIQLQSALPTIGRSLTLNGPGADQLAIAALANVRVLTISGAEWTVAINDLTLRGGNTTSNGGGLAATGSGDTNTDETLTITRSIITGNRTTHQGGGIYTNDVELTLADSTLSNNISGHAGVQYSQNDGGGAFLRQGSVTITGSTISGNQAIGSNSAEGGEGGGLYIFRADVDILHSTISGNRANDDGGGIKFENNASGLMVNVKHCTIVDNRADRDDSFNGAGGGIAVEGTSLPKLSHTIVANNFRRVNSSPARDEINGSVDTATSDFNLIADAGQAGGLLDTNNGNIVGSVGVGYLDPQLGPLKYNGGRTQTHALLAGSPAMDAGATTSAETHDQRGAPFVRQAGSNVDIGAYERQTLAPSAFIVTTTADELDYDNADASLREAITSANGSVGVDTITFAPALAGGTIDLQQSLGELDITDEVTIHTDGLAGGITIDAGDGLDNLPLTGDGIRIFDINGGATVAVAVTLRGLTLTGGDAILSGGAIRTRENLTLQNATITGNAAIGSGGGINAFGTTTIIDSTISGNAAANGGGIYAYGTTTITSSTISGNTAGVYGGGINAFGTTTIAHSTITQNTARAGYGSGVASSGGSISTTTVTHSIIADNTHEDVAIATFFGTANTFVSGSGNDDGHNLVGTGADFIPFNNAIDRFFNDTSSQTGELISAGLDPTLKDNGGSTFTHALLAGSDAIDAGATTSAETHDQRGAPFVRKSGSKIDIGAYEKQTLSPVVDTLVDESDGDYSSGDLSLREAIELTNANPGAETITFASPLFDTAQTIALNGQLPTITEALTITGPGQTLLTIDAQQNGRIFEIDDGDNNNQIDVTLSGLKLTGGKAPDGTDNVGNGEEGGAIESRENLTITDSTITGNRTGNGTNTNNFADGGGGGGIYSTGGDLTIRNSTISNNTTGNGGNSSSSGGRGGRGGGINSRIGNLTIENSIISGNTTGNGGDGEDGGPGGGIYHRYGDLTIRNSTISSNTTGSGGDGEDGGNGGGIYLSNGNFTIENSTINGNTTGNGGGGAVNGDGDGGDGGDGGGIFSFGGDLTIENSTISGNTTGKGGSGDVFSYDGYGGSGGGIHSAGNVTLRHSTVTKNTAQSFYSDGAGGISALNNVTLANSIVSGNLSDSSAPDIRLQGAAATITANYSLIGVADNLGTINGNVGNQTGTAAAPLDPGLEDLADNGGPTQTHALKATSPAIDKGDPNIAAPPPFDQRGDGFSRILDGDGDTFEVIDIGAYEFFLPPNEAPNAFAITAPDVDENSPPLDYFVDITYTDDNAIDYTSIDLNDLEINRVGGGDAPTISVAVPDEETNGSPRVGSYTFTPPGGSWDAADNGDYEVVLMEGEVLDDGTPALAALGGVLAIFTVNIPAPAPNANFDGDNDVDGFDFLIWQRNFMTGTEQSQGDANYNGTIDGTDLGIWQAQFGKPPVTVVAAITHEPSAAGIGQEDVIATEVVSTSPAQLAAIAGWHALDNASQSPVINLFEPISHQNDIRTHVFKEFLLQRGSTLLREENLDSVSRYVVKQDELPLDVALAELFGSLVPDAA